MTLKNLKGHNEMCGGYSYSGEASFYGANVREVLEEIKEFASESGNDIGEGFGKPGKHMGACWGIKINDIPYVGGWAGWKNEYKHQFDDYEVEKVSVYGGWYCFYDFYIYTKQEKKKSQEDDEEKAFRLAGLR